MNTVLELNTTANSGPPAAIEVRPTKQSSARRIFFGLFGLRAGWSLAIYLLVVIGIVLGIHTVQSHIKVLHEGTAASAANAQLPALPFFLSEGIVFCVFFLLSWGMAFIERRRVAVFGLGGQRPVSRFLFGAFWGFASLSLLVGILRGLHLLSFDSRLLHGFAALRWGAALLVGFLLLGCFEEYSFRGYFQFTLTRGLLGLGNRISSRYGRAIAFWIASAMISSLFLFAHTFNSGEDKIGLVVVFCASFTFLFALWRTGSLWWAIGFHMTWDWAQSFLYGVPDSGEMFQGHLYATHALGNPILSGGAVGPEGSILAIPIFALAMVVVWFTHPSPQPPLATLRPKMRKADEPVRKIAESPQLLNANC
jgi:uncharacterized protein